MQVVSALRTPAFAALVIGCGDPAARVTLAPVPLASATCGLPTGANQLSITAFGESREAKKAFDLDKPIAIGDFPADTVQLGVEVIIGGGAIGAAGKTAPLAFADLEDGTAIPIAMVPPGGFCPVGPMVEARRKPLLAQAGNGVLVVGGTGDMGPLSTAEFYDPTTGTFAPVDVPAALQDPANGLAGVVLTPLPDGRLVLTGGSRGLLTVFDPETRQFGATFALAPARAFHGAIASENGVIVSGGCAGVEQSSCNSVALHSTIEYTLEGESIATGASLPAAAVAEGATLFDDGDGNLVLAGGFGTPGEAYRFRFEDRDAALLTGLGAQPIAIDGGAVMTAFEPDLAQVLAAPK